ncbi:MAG: hypothetical protein LDL44_13025 [Caenispirillum sp.]|nr:hypothetical protein [Caenispirillum sp.]
MVFFIPKLLRIRMFRSFATAPKGVPPSQRFLMMIGATVPGKWLRLKIAPSGVRKPLSSPNDLLPDCGAMMVPRGLIIPPLP